MTEDQFKPFVRSFFEGFRVPIVDIPKNSRRTPDFEISSTEASALLELKIKGDSLEEVKADLATLKSGHVLSKSKELTRRNTLSGLIADGCEQLSTHDPSHEKFHFLWFHCTGPDADLHFEQFRRTLFGAQWLFSPNLTDLVECFYFHWCDFYRFRDVLDGVFVSQAAGENVNVTFWINSLSPRSQDFRVTKFYAVMNEAIVDPDCLEKEKTGLIADAACPRNSSEAILVYLQSKYKFERLQTLNFTRHTASVAIPDEQSP